MFRARVGSVRSCPRRSLLRSTSGAWRLAALATICLAVLVPASASLGASAGLAKPGWAEGGDPTNPYSQVAADQQYAAKECAANTLLVFRVRGSGETPGSPDRDRLGAWTAAAGNAAIAKGWRVRDMEASYPAPSLPLFQLGVDVATAVVNKNLVALAHAVKTIKDYRDVASQSWSGVRDQIVGAYNRCPERTILLAGYSYGGIVLRYVVRNLPPEVQAKIAHIDLVADPTEQGSIDSQMQHTGGLGARWTPEGIDTWPARRVNPFFKQTHYPDDVAGRTTQYCVPYDLVCEANPVNFAAFPGESKRHTSYQWQQIGRQAASTLRAWQTSGAKTLSKSGSGPVMIVADNSGSMSEDDGTGRVKIDGEKSALLTFLDGVEPGTPLGLRTYPDQSSGSSCNSGMLRFPVAPRDPAEMAALIRTVHADGDTPTAEALRAAAQDLRDGGYTSGTLVLVSDGLSTCTNPCDEAKQIAQSGIEIQTITIGFQISDKGREELQCIANAMNGTYLDANDSAGLEATLAQVSRPDISVTLDYPTSVIAEVGTDPGGLVRINATITNESQREAHDVTTRLRFDANAPGVTRPVLALGNLEPGDSRDVSWGFRPSLLLNHKTVQFTVLAQADNSVSDSEQSGSIDVTAQVTAEQAGPLLKGRNQIAILGDSYSSGEGADLYLAGTDTDRNACHRSAYTYLMQAFKLPESSVIACSGAVINDLFFGQAENDVDPQLDQLSSLVKTRGVDTVVLTLGGNDAGFPKIVKSCLLGRSDCRNRIHPSIINQVGSVPSQTFTEQHLDGLADALVVAYRAIDGVLNSKSTVSRRGSTAPIVVLPYPLGVPQTGRSCLATFGLLAPDELDFLTGFAVRLNGVIEAAVKAAQAQNVHLLFAPNSEDAFQPDHTICDRAPYVRALNSFNGAGLAPENLAQQLLGGTLSQLLFGGKAFLRGTKEIAHPNRTGYQAITSSIIRWSLSAKAKAAASSLKNAGPAKFTPPPPVKFSNEEIGQTVARRTPTLQGGTSYPLESSGFAPNSNVEIAIESQFRVLAQTQADARGAVSTRVGIPRDLKPGKHTLLLNGVAPDGKLRSIQIPIRVRARNWPLVVRAIAFGSAGSGILGLLAWLTALLALRLRKAHLSK